MGCRAKRDFEVRFKAAPIAKDTDPGMAAPLQLVQTSPGHFGWIDSRFDCHTTGHRLRDCGWASRSGVYACWTLHEFLFGNLIKITGVYLVVKEMKVEI